MTENEAIEELHKIRPRGGIIPQKRAEAIDMAINALEKQIPEKPYCVEDKMWCCPVCYNNLLSKWIIYNIELMSKSNGLPYCLNCGQAIDWSDTD